MDKPYKKLLWLSLAITIILFLIDEDEWDLSYRSVAGYIVVGLFFFSIFLLSSVLYWAFSKLWAAMNKNRG